LLPDAHINRSPESYMNNPEVERNQYDNNIDDTMTLLKIVDSSGNPFAMINWYALHAHIIEQDNHLVNSDNKG